MTLPIFFRRLFAFLCTGVLLTAAAEAQPVSLTFATAPQIDLSFNTINKLQNGIVIPNAITMNVEATGTQWDLYVGSVTSSAGVWDVGQYYGTAGNGAPPVGIFQIRVHNLSNTPQISGYAAMEDISTTTLDIIGNHLSAPNPAVHCSDANHVGTNTAGSYTVDPQCYQFRVDVKCTPGLNYRPGLYTMQLEFILAADL